MEFFCKNLVPLFIIVEVFTFFDVIMGHKLNASQKLFIFVTMIIVCQKPLKKLKINGIALFPFIFIRKPEDKENNVLINHEKIHLRQQWEMLVVFFYIFYVIEYYYWVFKLKDGDLAYRRISFEREAYANEQNLSYLKNRKFWSFRKYL